MTSKIAFFIFIFLLFIAFPVVFFYLLIQTNNLAWIDSIRIYPIIILSGLFLAFYAERTLRNKFQHDMKQTLFLLAAISVCTYAAFLLLMTWSRVVSFVSEVIDLTYFHTVIWQFSEFNSNPQIYLLDKPLFSLWSQHFAPILIFLAPLYWFVKDATLLMLIQAIAVISGAYPVYLIAKQILKSRSIGLALSFSYLAFVGLQFGFAYGFHEIMFFPPLFLWMYYFYLRKKIKLYFLFVILSLCTKEEVAFIMIFWSLYLLFVRRDKLFGLITGAIGLLWYVLCFHLIFPYFNKGTGGFTYWGQYHEEGSKGLLGLITFVFLHPFSFLQTLVTPDIKIETILLSFGSFAFLLLLYPPSLIIVFPSFMEKLMSSGVVMGIGAHYSAALTAVILVATFEVLPHLYQYHFIKKYLHNKNIFFSVLIFYTAFFSNIFFGYRGYSLVPIVHTSIYERGLSANNLTVLTNILQTLPKNATIAAEYQLVPHIQKNYKMISTWPGMTGQEDLVIIDTELPPVLGASSADYNKAIEALNHNKEYQLIVNNSGVLVFKKKSFTLPEIQTH